MVNKDIQYDNDDGDNADDDDVVPISQVVTTTPIRDIFVLASCRRQRAAVRGVCIADARVSPWQMSSYRRR